MDKVKVGYKKLKVWERADEFAFEVYRATKRFPKVELYGLALQLRKASLSVPANIVEGCSRQNKKETRHHANIALGSLGEARYLLDFARRLGYLDSKEYEKLERLGDEAGKLLWRFHNAF